MTGSCLPRDRYRKDCDFRPRWDHYVSGTVHFHNAVEESLHGVVSCALIRAQLRDPVSQDRGELVLQVPGGASAQVQQVVP
jgi:predicted 2-oxoglutarate/Fe(II)-dependent dioxygenase YbiX